MDAQTVINAAGAVIMFLLGIVVNSIKTGLEHLRDADNALAGKVQAIEVLVAGQYVRREDLDKVWEALRSQLERIEHKLDQKEDRK